MNRTGLRFPLYLLVLFLLPLSAGCSNPTPVVPISTSTPGNTRSTFYSLPGGGSCVQLGQNSRTSYSNVRVTNDRYAAHSETMIAQDPFNPLNLVGGAKYFPTTARYSFQIGYAFSSDGGCTWTDGGILPGFARTARTSDPSFAFGPNHEVYAAGLSVDQQESGIVVWKSIDGGKTFQKPVKVFASKPQSIFNDKPWIVVDQTRGRNRGSIYVVWSYDRSGPCNTDNVCSQELAFSRSKDGGNTFSPVQLIGGNAPFCTNPARGRPAQSTRCDIVLGTIPVVQPDGTIAVAAAYEPISGKNIPTRLIVVASRDGGTTWMSPSLIATIHDVSGTFPPQRYRNVTLPAFACDPATGQLSIAWADKINQRDTDILFSTSTDDGKTWSKALRVNDDPVRTGAYQFQPQLAVAPNGTISITFFDTRLKPARGEIDLYLTQSINHGNTFLKNIRVTSTSWNPATGAPKDDSGLQFIGDYQGLSVDSLFAHPFWNDSRTGSQEIFTAAVPSAQP